MFLIDVVSGLIATSLIFLIYFLLSRRKLAPQRGDVRSGLFLAFAEWAARSVSRFQKTSQHTWKPNILLPVIATKTLLGNFPLIKSIAYPHGTLAVLGLELLIDKVPEDVKLTKTQLEINLRELPRLVKKFGEEGIFTTFSSVSIRDYSNGISIALEDTTGQIFHPNILFLPFNPSNLDMISLKRIFNTAKESSVGIIIFDKDEKVGLGLEEAVHVWISDKELDAEIEIGSDRNFDLALLIGYRIAQNWAGQLNLWMCVEEGKKDAAEKYLKSLIYIARLSGTHIHISEGWA